MEERGEQIQGAFGTLQKHSLLQKAGGAAAFVPSDLRFWVVEQQWQRLKLPPKKQRRSQKLKLPP